MSRETKWTAVGVTAYIVGNVALGIYLAETIGGSAAPALLQLAVYAEVLAAMAAWGLWCLGRWAWSKARNVSATPSVRS